ncbi:MAG: hypothetical protein ACKO0M_06175, partial [Cyanobium sp.]
IADKYYNHSTNEITYAYAGITNLSKRSTYQMIGDDYISTTTIDPATLANIKTFGLYVDLQLANQMNVDGDIQMFLGPSSKAAGLLRTSWTTITADPSSVVAAISAFNQALRGNYAYPNGLPTVTSSPLANGLNVESSSYKPMISTSLSDAFGQAPVIADPMGMDHSSMGMM